jgi:hypothetical protein
MITYLEVTTGFHSLIVCLKQIQMVHLDTQEGPGYWVYVAQRLLPALRAA